MRFLFSTLVLSGFLSLVAASSAMADVKPEVVRQAKRATALVVQPNSFATAFCIDAAGYFVTNEHAVQNDDDGLVKLVLGTGEADEEELSARIVRLDKENDLALLKVSTKRELTALTLAKEPELVETQTVMVVGYPFGANLRTKDQDFPNVSVNVGRISSLRKSNGKLATIQTDAEINPGNSGGPMLSEAGEVVGVVRAKLRGTSVNFAIPVSFAHAMLARPDISFEIPRIAYDERYDERTLTARVVAFDGKPREYDLRLKLEEGDAQREIRFAHDKVDIYTAKVRILEKQSEPRLPVIITFSGGSIRGEIADANIKGENAGSKLSDLLRIERRGKAWALVGRNFEEHETKQRIKKLDVHLGETDLEVNVTGAESIEIYPPPVEKGVLNYQIIASAEGKEVASLKGQVIIESGKAPPVAAKPDNVIPARPGEFIALDGSMAWPEFLETAPIGVTKDGLKGLGRRYVRTKSGDFLQRDFTFEVVFSMAKDDAIAFVGFGEERGTGNSEPKNSVNFRIHSIEQAEGWVALAKGSPFGGDSLGNLQPGTHCAIIKKRGDQVTFAIDADNDGKPSDELQRVIPKFSEYTTFLNKENAFLFFGGGGTFKQARLVIHEK